MGKAVASLDQAVDRYELVTQSPMFLSDGTSQTVLGGELITLAHLLTALVEEAKAVRRGGHPWPALPPAGAAANGQGQLSPAQGQQRQQRRRGGKRG
ncbi:hypothetical protein B296_00009625 [Ensete ventricosum]|uniref:Uncharacterized protein n=1 Tax=Ensete ventricosum TaxID=4639 RepID=A0A426ZP36_ENSVE|nr:hypothetical protein B296_00009625 [Ensete ventricosum]